MSRCKFSDKTAMTPGTRGSKSCTRLRTALIMTTGNRQFAYILLILEPSVDGDKRVKFTCRCPVQQFAVCCARPVHLLHRAYLERVGEEGREPPRCRFVKQQLQSNRKPLLLQRVPAKPRLARASRWGSRPETHRAGRRLQDAPSGSARALAFRQTRASRQESRGFFQ